MLICVHACDFSSNPYADGKKLFKIHCANCHMEDGTGLEALYPPLQGADYLQSLGSSLACVIQNGIQNPIQVNGVIYEQAMPANEQLSEVEITNICNYVLSEWSDNGTYVSLEQVKDVLKACTKEE